MYKFLEMYLFYIFLQANEQKIILKILIRTMKERYLQAEPKFIYNLWYNIDIKSFTAIIECRFF